MAFEFHGFWKRIAVDEVNGCWLWRGYRTETGYGMMNVPKPSQVHRLSWIAHRGEIPNGLFVCHRCDIPCCCNPEHLFLGTAKDNRDDMMNKGRYIPYTRRPGWRGKLTDVQARAIRDGLVTTREAMDDFGITRAAISQIRLRKSWKHLD